MLVHILLCALFSASAFSTLAQQPTSGVTPAEAAQPNVHGAWTTRDSSAAIASAAAFLGVDIPGATAIVSGVSDPSLVTDTPVTDADPVWVVSTKPIQFVLDAVEGVDVKTQPMSFEVLVRARDGLVLRAQSPLFLVMNGKGKVESLDDKAFRKAECGACDAKVSDQKGAPKLTLAKALSLSEKGAGAVGGAQQIIAFVRTWNDDCRDKQPRNVWFIDARSDSSVNSMTGGMEESRAPKAGFLVSLLVSVVDDEKSVWINSRNFPRPLVRSTVDGTIMDPGSSGKKKGDK